MIAKNFIVYTRFVFNFSYANDDTKFKLLYARL